MAILEEFPISYTTRNGIQKTVSSASVGTAWHVIAECLLIGSNHHQIKKELALYGLDTSYYSYYYSIGRIDAYRRTLTRDQKTIRRKQEQRKNTKTKRYPRRKR